MTLAFVAFHMRDYQRDTQHLSLEAHGAYFLLLQHCWTHGRIPLDETSRAAICKVTVARWRRQLAPLVAPFFDANGENKRASAEIAKVEKMRLQRAMAGHNGGLRAQQQKAIRQAVAQATAQATARRPLSESSSGREAIKKDIINTSFGTARARDPTPEENPTISTEQEEAKRLAEEARARIRATTSVASGELEVVLREKGWAR
jgi:uncharacterized protein YdaU (DUF1376 family)